MPTVMRRINVISRCASIYKSERMQGEIGGCHHAFVFCISAHPGASQEEIAQRLCLNKSTVARTLSYLEEHGFVRRESDCEDKRVLRIYPTEKMLEVYPRVKKLSGEWNAAISNGISAEDMEIFNRVIEKMEENARILALGGDGE